MKGIRGAIVIAFFLLSPAMARSQAAMPEKPSPQPPAQQLQTAQNPTASAQQGTTATPAKPQAGQKQKDQSEKGEQTKRMLWIVPNFAAVSANTKFTPLTAHQKFVLAFHDSFDYSAFTWTAVVAAQSMALNSDPELGSGAAGYGRYYWRAFVDGVSGTYFTEAIVPALTHEDPRYFTMGHGGFFRRFGYALSRTVLTRTDSGGTSFNWSEAGGNALESGLSNAYYPPEERGVNQTLRNWGTQMESAALNNIAKEFWPDIHQLILRLK